MGRQRTEPPYYSTLVTAKKQYSTVIPKPVAERMKEKSNSTWRVTFKKETGSIRLYWEPFNQTPNVQNKSEK